MIELDFSKDDVVSIHAPVWVRPMFGGNGLWGNRFQFTHPCGCDV